jgi:hypothetical protein
MLRCHEKAGNYASYGQPSQSGLLDIAIKTPRAGKKEERYADVGGHQGGMRQDVRIKPNQCKGDKRCPISKTLSRGKKDYQRKRNGEQPSRKAHLKNDLVTIAVVASQEFLAARKRVILEKASR